MCYAYLAASLVGVSKSSYLLVAMASMEWYRENTIIGIETSRSSLSAISLAVRADEPVSLVQVNC